MPSADPAFPSLHIRPRRGWLNDPNGACRIDGRYHVFFQHNPNAPVHEAVHWGHVSSTDLLDWRPEPVALHPRPGQVDAGGCWSGCVVDDHGTPTAVYTAVRTVAWDAGAVLARSDRSLRTWRQDDHRQAATPDAGVAEVRDPFVFTRQGRRYAVQGAGGPQGPPQLLLWGCDDLTDWRFLGPLLTTDDPVAAEVAPAQIWECPNLFPSGEGWVLVLSLWQRDGHQDRLAGVRYLLGDLVPRPGVGLRFVARSGGLVDHGPTFYAPQVLVDGDRVLLWGWAWEGAGRTAEAVIAAGWAGVLTFPRELTVAAGRLASRPARELVGLRQESLDTTAGITGPAFEVEAEGPVRLRLVGDAGRDELVLAAQGPVRVLVDGSLVEAFAPTGPSTTRAYPDAGTRWQLAAAPETTRVWRLAR